MADDNSRDERGRFAKVKKTDLSSKTSKINLCNVMLDHNFTPGLYCDGPECKRNDCGTCMNDTLGKHVDRDGWRNGLRIVDFSVLLTSLRACQACKLGPVPLTVYSLLGEMKKGLGGYLYVRCNNIDCGHVNCVPYGKTHHLKPKGMPCFAVNTKLGTAMIDNIGGSVKVNNFLSTLNIPTLADANLKKMERRAGDIIEKHAKKSAAAAARDAFEQEMSDTAMVESKEAEQQMENIIDDLGVCALSDASPHVKQVLEQEKAIYEAGNSWTDSGDETPTKHSKKSTSCSERYTDRPVSKIPKSRKKLDKTFPCKTRTGMTCAVDTAWHKRGFDSLTSHTFFMSKSKYGKKVVKTVVSHRTCGTCKWWIRNRPGQTIRKHRCVRNHTGSARLMESVSGEQGIKELQDEGTQVEYLEGDGDNTLIVRLKKNLDLIIKKRFDKNHIIKNIGKHLYALQSVRENRLSKNVVLHIQKCLKYAFAKNAGDKDGLKENLCAIIPHQFGDHTLCQGRFCGYKRNQNETYKHRSLPYKVPLKNQSLRAKLESMFVPIIEKSEQFANLGSSQQCEHANREVTLRAPKGLFYGNSESLDHRVHATAAFINEGRHYIPQCYCYLSSDVPDSYTVSTKVHSEAGLSPGINTVKYADKCMIKRKRVEARSLLPSTKRRRLILKQERGILRGANEALEGASYQSEIGHSAVVDIEQLPSAIPRGNFKAVTLHGEPTLVSSDLETTDLIRDGNVPHITQIAAIELKSKQTFNKYVLPKQPIADTARLVTGISVTSSNVMTVKGCPVEHVSITTALTDFCVWLTKFSNVLMVAHNGRRFDFPVIICAMNSVNMQERFFKSVSGFVDSMAVFRKQYPGRTSYKQADLVRDILGTSYGAHDAIEDVRALGCLIMHAIKSETLVPFSFQPKAVHYNHIFNREKSNNLPSLNVLVSNGICKYNTAENIAGSGLNLKHLRIIFNRDGEDGLINTFISKNGEGQPRVTSAKRVLDAVIPKLVEFFSKN